MSNAVRGTSGAQGSGGLAAGGGASASRGAPADGGSFGGVLGAAMAEPARPAHGAGDGKADGNGTSDGNSDGRRAPTSADATTLVAADLAQTVGGTLTGTPAASGTSDGLSQISAGPTGRPGKKRPSDATAADPTQAAQAAVVVAASLAPPATNGLGAVAQAAATGAAATGAAATAAVAIGAATKISGFTGGPADRRAATIPYALGRPSPLASNALTPSSQELVGPEDGTGLREPDGIDPATATVGRPAALASGGLVAPLPAGMAAANADPTTTDSATTPASGGPDHQPATPVVAGAAPSSVTLASTTVVAALASGERDPSRNPPTTGGDTTPAGTISATVTVPPSGGAIANVPLAVTPDTQPTAAAANGVNVIAADGTSQPLANALGSQVLAMVAAGRSQVTVHLSPPDLGALTVHVEVQSRDVSAWFASPQPQVQQAVSDALAQLHGSLSGAGLNLSGAWVGADVSGGNGRPAAAPLPVRRAAAAPAGVDPVAAGTTSTEGLSVYV